MKRPRRTPRSRLLRSQWWEVHRGGSPRCTDRSSIASAVRRCRLTHSGRGRPARMEARTTPLSNSTRPPGADSRGSRQQPHQSPRARPDQSPGLVRQQLFAPCHPGSPRPRAVAWPAATVPRGAGSPDRRGFWGAGAPDPLAARRSGTGPARRESGLPRVISKTSAASGSGTASHRGQAQEGLVSGQA